jgi:mannitol-1-phosphate 5-dehydrogenase
MALNGNRVFVGFGFGPIQAGLFVYEAFRSEGFRRLLVAEAVPAAVRAIRRAGNSYTLNIAHADRTESACVGPIEINDPACEEDRRRLIAGVVEAEEISTAVPSVEHYVSAGPASLHRILGEGLRRKAATGGPRCVVYAAENHTQAAEILQARVLDEIPPPERENVRQKVQFLNTVIGKISGLTSGGEELRAQGLVPVTPGEQRAFLVEAFNRILISKIRFEFPPAEKPFQRGITVFDEKEDLLPFGEAKLYSHNATHALAAYVGAVRSLRRIAEIQQFSDICCFLRAAFVQESGEALIRKYSGADPLFTPQGYAANADVLLARMLNPYLYDTVQRVGRNPERKLGWDDRLVGTMRMAMATGVQPLRHAFGAAAALHILDPSLQKDDVAERLRAMWRMASPAEEEQQAVLRLIEQGRVRLESWRNSGFPNLEGLFTPPGFRE